MTFLMRFLYVFFSDMTKISVCGQFCGIEISGNLKNPKHTVERFQKQTELNSPRSVLALSLGIVLLNPSSAEEDMLYYD